MDTMERIGATGLVPVVVINNADDAVAAAEALLAGGIDVMEITMRTEAGLQAIKNVAQGCPEMLVGAGTVLTLEKCQQAVEAGAKFIVSPGFNEKIVAWCVEHDVPVTPGCVTPTEIEAALAYGLRVLKFFPAGTYGGVKGCKSLHGPYKSANISFIPTGGVNNDNLADFADKPFIHAVGGSWLCSTEDIDNHDFAAITRSAKTSVDVLLGFELVKVSIWQDHQDQAQSAAARLTQAFGFRAGTTDQTAPSGPEIEFSPSTDSGRRGSLTIRTNRLDRAIHHLGKRGFSIDETTATYQGSKLLAVSLKEAFGGFEVRLVQK
jgi:2-dehydro-3-deoxyphosphogluconate aldolase/(4S)-4-hydroxy-2-oxoglutarate aldolase